DVSCCEPAPQPATTIVNAGRARAARYHFIFLMIRPGRRPGTAARALSVGFRRVRPNPVPPARAVWAVRPSPSLRTFNGLARRHAHRESGTGSAGRYSEPAGGRL